jgi:hypothetical protein
MKSHEHVVLHRRSILEDSSGLPALCSVAMGACGERCLKPREARFEGLAPPAETGSLGVDPCAFGEVACALGGEAFSVSVVNDRGDSGRIAEKVGKADALLLGAVFIYTKRRRGRPGEVEMSAFETGGGR